ncbi:MAG: 30S ribosomal protein S8 [Leptolyngbya sp. PLA3]|nr:MAG: 30S ribosomal protein S8 [Cyanobacteria bacterium CYA]MCE7969098.1 30S ribosomal protein S8 [Leptolyngbya sp. PL-A3]
MSFNDPIADMLTRIRNAVRNRAKHVECLNSKVCRGIAQTLVDEGFIVGYQLIDNGREGRINVTLKYGPRGEALLHSLQRESKPGCRVYRKVDDLDRVQQGLGISILSTSSGVMSDRRCRELKVGGELLCTVI